MLFFITATPTTFFHFQRVLTDPLHTLYPAVPNHRHSLKLVSEDRRNKDADIFPQELVETKTELKEKHLLQEDAE